MKKCIKNEIVRRFDAMQPPRHHGMTGYAYINFEIASNRLLMQFHHELGYCNIIIILFVCFNGFTWEPVSERKVMENVRRINRQRKRGKNQFDRFSLNPLGSEKRLIQYASSLPPIPQVHNRSSALETRPERKNGGHAKWWRNNWKWFYAGITALWLNCYCAFMSIFHHVRALGCLSHCYPWHR